MDLTFAEILLIYLKVCFLLAHIKIINNYNYGNSEHASLYQTFHGMMVFHQQNLALFIVHNSKKEMVQIGPRDT